MENKLYSIFDVKAQAYGNVFSCATDGLAERVFAQIIVNGGNPDYTNYAADFCLYCVGSFDNNSGAVVSCSPRMVISAISVLERIRGAAVGDLPLKSQSASEVDSSDASEVSKTACDDDETSSSVSNKKGE